MRRPHPPPVSPRVISQDRATGLDQLVPTGQGHRFLTGVGAQLAVDGLDVALDGVGRQVERRTDLPDAQRALELEEYVELPGGERLVLRPRGDRGPERSLDGR